MSDVLPRSSDDRRLFLTRLAATAGALGVVAAPRLAAAAPQGTSAFQPARHSQDDWLDRLPGRHRLVLDVISPAGADSVRLYTNNFFDANKDPYGLQPPDLAVVIILRHFATPFAYNDAIWGKYGAALSKIMSFTDPATHAAPTKNVYANTGITLPSLIGKGVHFAVCGVATHLMANVIANETKGTSGAIYDELAANLIGNSHLVSAGIVAVNRAQERGYTFGYVG
jgi:intracellular sulfur oxidation DsrE/DsrF family protein